jgi:type IV secretion system protein VirB1
MKKNMNFVINFLTLLVLAILSNMPANAGLSVPVMDLAKRCAPEVHPLTVGYLVSHESHNNLYAINVNVPKGTKSPLTKQPHSLGEAIKAVKWLTAQGYSFDVGLGQINSNNFYALKTSAEKLFDACENLRATQIVLNYCYQRAIKEYAPDQSALRHALSCYNTGSLTAGLKSGYVSKVLSQIGESKTIIPALESIENTESIKNSEGVKGTEQPVDKNKQSKDKGFSDAFTDSSKDAFGEFEGNNFLKY